MIEKRLTELSKTSGWAAKIGPGALSEILSKLPKMNDKNLIVGIDTSDDAAVYKLNDEIFYYCNNNEKRFAKIIEILPDLHGHHLYRLESLSKYKNKFSLIEEEIGGLI